MNWNSITKWFRSSTGEGVSMTWKGIATGVIPYILLVGPLLGIDVTNADLVPVVDGVSLFIMSLWAVFSSAAVIFGLARKIHNRF